MKKETKTIGAYIIGSAIIWGATIILCSLKLKGTDCFSEITGGGAGIHLILIWGPLAAQLKKMKKEE